MNDILRAHLRDRYDFHANAETKLVDVIRAFRASLPVADQLMWSRTRIVDGLVSAGLHIVHRDRDYVAGILPKVQTLATA